MKIKSEKALLQTEISFLKNGLKYLKGRVSFKDQPKF